jgi:hypothetical protein
MELAGLEPAASWVRYAAKPSYAALGKPNALFSARQ